MSKTLSFGKKYLVALFLATFLYSRQILTFKNEWRAHLVNWSWNDTFAILFSIVCIALLATLIDAYLKKYKHSWARRIYHGLFLLVIFHVLLSNIKVEHFKLDGTDYVRYAELFDKNPEAWVMWGLVLAVAIASIFIRKITIPKLAAIFLLYISPLSILVLWDLFRIPVVNYAQGELLHPFQESKDKNTPIFLFIFDEWSFNRTVNEKGHVRDLMPNLQKLSAHSFNCTKAYSPSLWTVDSIPRLLFGDDKVTSYKKQGEFHYLYNNAPLAEANLKSIFQRAEELGYNSQSSDVQPGLESVLGRQPNRLHSDTIFKRKKGFLYNCFHHFLHNLWYYFDPVSRKFFPDIHVRYRSLAFYEGNKRGIDRVHHWTEDIPNNTLSLFHLLLPHPPYVFNEDGTFAKDFNFREKVSNEILGAEHMAGTLKDYNRHLSYLDTEIGNFVDALKDKNFYNDALIIMTSDHGWRWLDPDPGNITEKESLHVPLFIKLPNQDVGSMISEEIYTKHLYYLIETVMENGDLQESEVLNLLYQPSR